MLSTRPAVRDDAWAVAGVHEVARAASYGIERPTEVDPERVTMWWTVIGDPRRATVLVAEEGDALLGFLSFGPPIHEVALTAPVLELHGLYVLPQQWGRGIGSRLHASFVKRLAGGRIGVLDVWDGNVRAIAFYERRGWRPDGRVRPAADGHAYLGMALSSPR